MLHIRRAGLPPPLIGNARHPAGTGGLDMCRVYLPNTIGWLVVSGSRAGDSIQIEWEISN